MADMTREEVIKIFNTVLFMGSCSCPKEEAEECLRMAISDMKRVEQLEAYFGDKTIAEIILADDKEFSAWLERIKFHVKKADEYARKCENLEAENKRLTEGIERVKAEIETLFKNAPSKGYEQGVCDVGDLINKYLGE